MLHLTVLEKSGPANTQSAQAITLDKRQFLKTCLGGLAALSTQPLFAAAPDSPFRPPSVPLITCDPNFSIWSSGDALTDVNTTHWTGKPHRLTSLVKIDGAVFRILGHDPKSTPALPQVSVAIHPTRTIYDFEGEGIHITLSFMTAALPDDLMLLSRPLGYLTWTARAVDGKEHAVSVYFESNGEIAVNKPSQEVSWASQTTGRVFRLPQHRRCLEDGPAAERRRRSHRLGLSLPCRYQGRGY